MSDEFSLCSCGYAKGHTGPCFVLTPAPPATASEEPVGWISAADLETLPEHFSVDAFSLPSTTGTDVALYTHPAEPEGAREWKRKALLAWDEVVARGVEIKALEGAREALEKIRRLAQQGWAADNAEYHLAQIVKLAGVTLASQPAATEERCSCNHLKEDHRDDGMCCLCQCTHFSPLPATEERVEP